MTGTEIQCHHHIFDGLYFTFPDGEQSKQYPSLFDYISIDEEIEYHGFCDDFGPMNLGMIYKFCLTIDQHLQVRQSRTLALLADGDRRKTTNTAFLIGSYMIMRLNSAPDDVAAAFAPIHASLLSYRDVSPGEQNFHLYLRDCWEGIHRAKQIGWVDFSSPAGFDAEEYEHLDDPFNADLHEVVRGKFFAMRGPVALPDGRLWADRGACTRNFSPRHFLEILEQLEVRVVVRLNTAEYDAADFRNGGIEVLDLAFEDCSTPPPEVVAKFLMVAEAVPGALAVHCKAGLGRTGTLIALYMMKHHGFTARQAIGWLRVVRPGSVIGVQQQYLIDMEETMRLAGSAARRTAPNPWLVLPPGGDADPAAVRRVIASACADVDARVRDIVDRQRAAAAAAAHAAAAAAAGAAAAHADAADGGTHSHPPRTPPPPASPRIPAAAHRRDGALCAGLGSVSSGLDKLAGDGGDHEEEAAAARRAAAAVLAEHVTKASDRRNESRQVRASIDRLRASDQ